VEKRPTGRPRRSDRDMDYVRQALIQSPKKSIFQASAELQVPQMTVHRIL
jgi:hypothetical protein